MLLLTINLEFEICKKLGLSYLILFNLVMFLNQYSFIKIVILFLIFMHLKYITSNMVVCNYFKPSHLSEEIYIRNMEYNYFAIAPTKEEI